VEIIIAAITVGILLLWGGVLGLVKMVELFERKHILGLGAYTTLVAGLVMGLVLFNSNEAQKKHQLNLQAQMDENSKRLSQLGERLVGQLEEKANLTQSEFEAIDRMQDTTSVLNSTRQSLSQQKVLAAQIQQSLEKERQANKKYQDDVNRQLEERHQMEEKRYQDLYNSSQVQSRAIDSIQKKLANLQDETNRIKTQTAAMQNAQKNLLSKLNSNRQAQDQAAQQVAVIQKKLGTLSKTANKTSIQLNDLHKWGKAAQTPEKK
jgi:chromosome segregation ATPase